MKECETPQEFRCTKKGSCMDMQRVETAVKQYRKIDSQQASVLTFFDAIWQAQDDISRSTPSVETMIDRDAAGDSLATHQPLFMLAEPSITLPEFLGAVHAISKIISEKAGLGDDASAALIDADFSAAIDEDLLGGALSDVDGFTSAVAEKLGADADEALTPVTVDFVLTTALTPFLEGPSAAIIKSLEEIDWRVWDSADCPICGTPASNSRIVDAGELQGSQRVLACPLCHAEWDYQRVRCTRCGNRSHENLHYLFDERDPGHRIHVCEVCHGYIKTSVERELDVTVVPQVEDVVTLPLDDLASSKGYSPLGEDVTD